MSLRPRKEEAPAAKFKLFAGGGNIPAAPTAAQAGLSFSLGDAIGAPLRTVAPSPYNDRAHLTPPEFEDHDGGPWEEAPNKPVKYESVPQKWVVAPALGGLAPALCVFPRRLSNNISFSPEVHLSFSAVWTPIIARFTQLYLTDVDKKGQMPDRAQQQHWLVTYKGKTATSLTSVVLRIRVNDQGDQLEGWALYLPDTDFVQSFIDFPPPPAAQVGFDSSTAVVVNAALTGFDQTRTIIDFSKLDQSVEMATRVERGAQAWSLFVRDVSQRSDATMENVNFIRNQTFYSHFRGQERNMAFWEVDAGRAPE